jgi:arylsulfatase A-like enzyme
LIIFTCDNGAQWDPTRTLFWVHLDAIPVALDGHPEPNAMGRKFKSKKRKQVDYFASWYVRSGKWKLIGWNNDTPLLFDVSTDPGEYKNLATQYSEVVSGLRQEFLKWMFTTEQPYVGKKEIWQQLFQ